MLQLSVAFQPTGWLPAHKHFFVFHRLKCQDLTTSTRIFTSPATASTTKIRDMPTATQMTHITSRMKRFSLLCVVGSLTLLKILLLIYYWSRVIVCQSNKSALHCSPSSQTIWAVWLLPAHGLRQSGHDAPASAALHRTDLPAHARLHSRQLTVHVQQQLRRWAALAGRWEWCHSSTLMSDSYKAV